MAVGIARVTSAGAPFQQVEFYFGDFGTPSPGHDRAEISPVTDPVCPPDFAIGPETGSPLETGQLVVKAAEVGL